MHGREVRVIQVILWIAAHAVRFLTRARNVSFVVDNEEGAHVQIVGGSAVPSLLGLLECVAFTEGCQEPNLPKWEVTANFANDLARSLHDTYCERCDAEGACDDAHGEEQEGLH
jgi:hypothetical protein